MINGDDDWHGPGMRALAAQDRAFLEALQELEKKWTPPGGQGLGLRFEKLEGLEEK
jgi:hypothetical protein